MKILSKLLILGTLLVLTTAIPPKSGIHRVKKGTFQYNSLNDEGYLSLFALFGGGLPAGGYLKISFSATANFGDDNIKFASYLLSGTTDVPANLDDDDVGCTDDGYDHYCKVAKGFDAGAAYGLVFYSGTSALTPNVMSGPIGLETRLNNDKLTHGAVIDHNPSFDVMFIKPEAVQLSWAFTAGTKLELG